MVLCFDAADLPTGCGGRQPAARIDDWQTSSESKIQWLHGVRESFLEFFPTIRDPDTTHRGHGENKIDVSVRLGVGRLERQLLLSINRNSLVDVHFHQLQTTNDVNIYCDQNEAERQDLDPISATS